MSKAKKTNGTKPVVDRTSPKQDNQQPSHGGSGHPESRGGSRQGNIGHEKTSESGRSTEE